MIHDTHRLNHFQRLLRGGSTALVASLLLPALAQAAIVVTGSVTGGGTPYNGTDDPWATSNFTIGSLPLGSTLSINAGSDVNNTGTAQIATATNIGTVTVDGAGSTWTNTSSLSVATGNGSKGTLNITGGGSVSNGGAAIAGAPASVGSVTVSGAGSAWTITGGLNLGSPVLPPAGEGHPSLAITSGGSVSSVDGAINGSPSSGTSVTVSGAGSNWTNTGNLSIGPVAGDRKATLEITGGATVSSVNGIINGGTSVSRTETVTVSGVGSTWSNSGNLTIVAGGFAALNINNGGLVVATALKEGTSSGLALDGGTFRITSTSSTTNFMTLNAGGGTLDIPTAANTFTVAPGFGGFGGTISGAGGLTKTAAGTLALAQGNTYVGGTTINGGKLLANNTTGSATGTGDVTVNTGGTLGGTGKVSGAVSVGGGGTLAPGASIGTLNTGNILLTDAASKLSLELNLGVTPAADLLNVTGGITLTDSSLDLSVADVPLGLPTMTFLVAANDANDPILGTFATINGVPAGYVAILNYAFTGTDALGRIGDGNDLAVTLQVPEPGTIVLLSEMALVGGGFVARRKKFGWAS